MVVASVFVQVVLWRILICLFNIGCTTNKRGHGSERQAKVLVMVESEPCISAPKKGKPNRKVDYLKMVGMEYLKFET